MSQFEELGREVSEALDAEPSVERQLAQRAALIEAASEPRRSGSSVLWPAVAALAAGGLVFAIFGPGGASPDPIGTEPIAMVADSGGEVHAGMYLAAPPDQTLSLEVHEGGDVELSPGARGRVAAVTQRDVNLVLEGGELAAAVLPEQPTAWTVEAGPLSVEADRAVFRMEWDPERYYFRLVVEQGSVRVRGGELGEEGVELTAGKQVEADREGFRVDSGELALAPKRSEDAGGEESLLDEGDDGEDEEAEDTEGSVERRRPARARANAEAWLELADGGDYRAALREAEAAGFSRLTRKLGPSELKKLADTARLARDSARAREALEALRTRFPGQREGKLASFLLGRVAVDLDRDYATAAKWFERYVTEHPKGRFAPEARGRVIDALKRSGDRAGARAAAKQYLELHPEGSYAKLAKSVLGQ